MPDVDADRAPAGELVVRRSGGIAGVTRTARLDLDSDRGTQARSLLERIDLPSIAAGPGPSHPDRFVYSISAGGTSATVGENQLTGDLGALVKLVLDDAS